MVKLVIKVRHLLYFMIACGIVVMVILMPSGRNFNRPATATDNGATSNDDHLNSHVDSFVAGGAKDDSSGSGSRKSESGGSSSSTSSSSKHHQKPQASTAAAAAAVDTADDVELVDPSAHCLFSPATMWSLPAACAPPPFQLPLSATAYAAMSDSVIAIGSLDDIDANSNDNSGAVVGHKMARDITGWTLYFKPKHFKQHAGAGAGDTVCMLCGASNSTVILVPKAQLAPLFNALPHYLTQPMPQTSVTNAKFAFANKLLELFMQAELSKTHVYLCRVAAVRQQAMQTAVSGDSSDDGSSNSGVSVLGDALGVGDDSVAVTVGSGPRVGVVPANMHVNTDIQANEHGTDMYRPVVNHWRVKRVVHSDGPHQLYGCTNQTLNCCQKKTPGYPEAGCRHVLKDVKQTWVASAPCCRFHMIKLYLTLTRFLDKYKIQYFLGYGSLLSLVRSPDRNMNPYDYDFDLVIFRNDAARVLRLGSELTPMGYHLNGDDGQSMMQILYSSPHNIHRNVMDFFVLPEHYRTVHTPFGRQWFAGYNVMIPRDPHVHLGRGKYGKLQDYMNFIQVKTENWLNQTEGGDHFRKYKKPYNNGTRDDGAHPLPSWTRELRTRANALLYEDQLPELRRWFPTCGKAETGECETITWSHQEEQAYAEDRENRKTKCIGMQKEFEVVPGKSWGKLSADGKIEFGRLDCDWFVKMEKGKKKKKHKE
jgi:hypothetical protein